MKYYGKAEAVAEKVVEAFRAGNVPKALAQTFLSTGRHSHGYSFTNQMLVALNGYSDAMGYGSEKHNSGWLSVGRRVRKGEKAMHILGPCLSKIDDPKADGGKRTIIRGFRVVVVFGFEQTEIDDAAKWAKHSKGREKADQFLAELPFADVAKAWGLTLNAYSGKDRAARGWYQHGKAIGLGVENLATWAHELIHAADDKAGKLVERGQHWRSETVAELGGAILMMVMGYETDADLGGAWEYISQYAKSAKIDPVKACMEVTKRTCEAVALILKQADECQGVAPDADDESATECHSMALAVA